MTVIEPTEDTDDPVEKLIKDTLLEAIRRCWSARKTSRAIMTRLNMQGFVVIEHHKVKEIP